MLREKLLTYRRREGLSQLQLAEKLGVSRQTIVRWENNANVPSDYEIKKIASLMGITEQHLLYDDDQNIVKEPVSGFEEVVNDISYGVNEQRKVLEDISSKQITSKDLEALKQPLDRSKEQIEIQKAILRQKKIRNIVLIIAVIIVLIMIGLFIYGISFYADDTHVHRVNTVYTDD